MVPGALSAQALPDFYPICSKVKNCGLRCFPVNGEIECFVGSYHAYCPAFKPRDMKRFIQNLLKYSLHSSSSSSDNAVNSEKFLVGYPEFLLRSFGLGDVHDKPFQCDQFPVCPIDSRPPFPHPLDSAICRRDAVFGRVNSSVFNRVLHRLPNRLPVFRHNHFSESDLPAGAEFLGGVAGYCHTTTTHNFSGPLGIVEAAVNHAREVG